MMTPVALFKIKRIYILFIATTITDTFFFSSHDHNAITLPNSQENQLLLAPMKRAGGGEGRLTRLVGHPMARRPPTELQTCKRAAALCQSVLVVLS